LDRANYGGRTIERRGRRLQLAQAIGDATDRHYTKGDQHAGANALLQFRFRRPLNIHLAFVTVRAQLRTLFPTWRDADRFLRVQYSAASLSTVVPIWLTQRVGCRSCQCVRFLEEF